MKSNIKILLKAITIIKSKPLLSQGLKIYKKVKLEISKKMKTSKIK
jgi:hypothetical protein